MERMNGKMHPIMVVGQDKLSYSIVADLLSGGYAALLLTTDRVVAEEAIHNHAPDNTHLCVITDWPEKIYSPLVILITSDEAEIKGEFIRKIEERCSENTIITVNLESVGLDEIQPKIQYKERLLGLNWTYPDLSEFFCGNHYYSRY